MKQHVITGVVAVVVAMGGGYAVQKKTAPTPTKEVVHQVHGKYGWGDLTDEQKADMVRMLSSLKGKTVEIFCGGAYCHDLAEDLDEVMDETGAKSSYQRPMLDIGAGLGIGPDTVEARKIREALAAATNGRLMLEIQTVEAKDKIIIALGRKPRR
jgi:hypothetical protein